ncbi:proline dehydrogenase family protein [Agriterribacter sp.]|uniref:proline dehydrogenase family protein n=1 Tax=Agriterribacter sp. TaxID=2821509 RepID=UPI002C32A420|nr:proline dehydrogenase family protein [Agriterribacter sp.]HTN08449.1 proline dehydrogenase family protein [Agriterribacter sp.]
MGTTVPISFDNTENAFAYKTDKELKKTKILFSSMECQLLVRWGTKVTPWVLKAGLPVKGLIRHTIFKQFVGGETLEETAQVAQKLGNYNVRVILDYGVEGGENDEAAFNHSMEEFIRVIRYAATQPNIPFISIKVTGFARKGLLEKLDASVSDQQGSLMKRYAKAVESLSDEERAEWQSVQRRMEKICRTAAEKGIGVLVDAEETWIQDPVDVITILMMERFNISKVVVYNTIQLYRHDRLNFLKDSLEAAEQRHFMLGAKLVRGAYMEKERERAAAMAYPSPIQPGKADTDRDYNDSIAFCIDHINKIGVIVATHNEYSNRYATELLQQKGLSLHHPHVHFSQLYGMSDHITFNLAKAGCPVSKYLPFGPIRDVVPYLMRRAQENSSVAGQAGRELGLIKKELQRRNL